jgi:hypothetical protein
VIQGAKPPPATITDTSSMGISISQEIVLLPEKPRFGLKINPDFALGAGFREWRKGLKKLES